MLVVGRRYWQRGTMESWWAPRVSRCCGVMQLQVHLCWWAWHVHQVCVCAVLCLLELLGLLAWCQRAICASACLAALAMSFSTMGAGGPHTMPDCGQQLMIF